jgi:hypothetical protein
VALSNPLSAYGSFRVVDQFLLFELLDVLQRLNVDAKPLASPATTCEPKELPKSFFRPRVSEAKVSGVVPSKVKAGVQVSCVMGN